MRHADHRNPGTYGGYYQNSTSTVDGQATYFGLEQQLPELHELFRSFSLHRNYSYRPELPCQAGSPEDDDVTSDRESSTSKAHSSKPVDRQKTYYARRQKKDKLLRIRQQAASQTSVLPEAAHAPESDFQMTRRLMPERDRLASSLFQSGSLRDEVGKTVIKDLVSLYASRNSDTFCISLNDSSTHCRTCSIQRSIANGMSCNWWRHVYRCRKEHERARGQFAEFCFLCLEWMLGRETWHRHAKVHTTTLPLRCSLLVFRDNLVRPGLCPDCIGGVGRDKGRPKFQQFLNVSQWRAHLTEHRAVLSAGAYRCAHPRCHEIPGFATLEAYHSHRADSHQIPMPHEPNVDGKDSPFVTTESRAERSATEACTDSEDGDFPGTTDEEDGVSCDSALLPCPDRSEPRIDQAHLPVPMIDGSEEFPATAKRRRLLNDTALDHAKCSEDKEPTRLALRPNIEIVIPQRRPGWEHAPTVKTANHKPTHVRKGCSTNRSRLLRGHRVDKPRLGRRPASTHVRRQSRVENRQLTSSVRAVPGPTTSRKHIKNTRSLSMTKQGSTRVADSLEIEKNLLDEAIIRLHAHKARIRHFKA